MLIRRPFGRRPMRVGIDYRPALQNREGIGRYTRELVRAMVELDFDRNLGLFGYTLAPMRFSRQSISSCHEYPNERNALKSSRANVAVR